MSGNKLNSEKSNGDLETTDEMILAHVPIFCCICHSLLPEPLGQSCLLKYSNQGRKVSGQFSLCSIFNAPFA